MLRALTIRNLAIIDALELEFGDGFSVLSGETGAGKSILIEALGLVLGDRADAALVRTGESQAEVSAEFTLDASLAARAWLREHAMEDSGAPNACLLRRVVGADGRSRAFINGAAASLANLRELGELLVEIHGQNEHQRLTRGETQRELLDDFGHQPEVLTAVAQAARDFAESEAELARLAAAAGRDPAQIDYLKHQLRELQSLRLADGELAALDADHRRLANAGRLIEEGQQVQDQLYGAEGSVQDQLGVVRQTLSGLGAIDPAFGAVEQTLEQAEVQVREAADAVRRALDRLDLDPERLREVEQRLEVIHDMARKHRVRPDELAAQAERLRADVEGSERAAGDMEKVEARRQAAVKSYRAAAAKLTAARKRWSKDLSAKVVALIRELGMGKAEFPIVVESTPQERPRLAGDDEVRFDFTANAGQAARPLAKVASGGELSRVALAIQVVANQSRSAATLIFDEVDAGVGGGTAEIVGEKLKALAARRQVLCVTHLPQVAAQGRQHYAIQKETRGGKTWTRVKALDDKGRVEELARMLGGREITASTQAHAKEMLKRGKGIRD
ncbi:MAG TPA: DNA repair protein RecN [Verrucomicrobiae bacterium]|nr:DNA repair protein RecN [Verrucomicrobiae bacterium]